MTSFASVDSAALGSVLTPHIARLLVANERRMAQECAPSERAEHHDRANKLANMLSTYYLSMGLLRGR